MRGRRSSRLTLKEYKFMTTKSDLTIVIPAKNEAKLMPRLLTSLTKQDYAKMPNTKVLVADAHSTDGTPEIVMSFSDRLQVSVIRGGLPSVGRNAGAAIADTRYVLFLDAEHAVTKAGSAGGVDRETLRDPAAATGAASTTRVPFRERRDVIPEPASNKSMARSSE